MLATIVATNQARLFKFKLIKIKQGKRSSSSATLDIVPVLVTIRDYFIRLYRCRTFLVVLALNGVITGLIISLVCY